MVTWEYRNLLCDAEGGGVQFPCGEGDYLTSAFGLHANVASMGKDGWEMVSHLVVDGVQSFWFKRPIGDARPSDPL